jgi:hypothetical protein
MIEERLRDFRLAQVPQDHGILEVDDAREQVLAHERLDLGVELVVAAHQVQILQELPCEERDDRAVIPRA